MKIYICDDDLNTVNLLAEWVGEYLIGSECRVRTYNNGIDVIHEISKNAGQETEIIFMDIKLKNDNGIDVAKEIKKMNQNAVIIFISGYSEYFEESFEAEPVYFLIKPLKKETFARAMEKAIEKGRQKMKKFLLLRKKEVSRIFFDDIYYVESVGRKIQLHCVEEKIECYEKLDDLEEKLEGDFVRCHKSYLVNMKWLQSIDNRFISLMNEMRIPISRAQLAQTKEKVFEYLGRQMR